MTAQKISKFHRTILSLFQKLIVNYWIADGRWSVRNIRQEIVEKLQNCKNLIARLKNISDTQSIANIHCNDPRINLDTKESQQLCRGSYSTRDEQYYRSDIVSRILALFGKYRISVISMHHRDILYDILKG